MDAALAQRISAAAHEGLPHANPLSTAQMERLAALALARRPRTALEVGCGPGSLSIALAQQSSIRVTALDINPWFLARARRTAAAERRSGEVTFVEADAKEYDGPGADLIVCIGSSQAYGTPREAVLRGARLLSPRGTLLFADLVWEAPPPRSFLEFLGVAETLYWPAEQAAATSPRKISSWAPSCAPRPRRGTSTSARSSRAGWPRPARSGRKR